MVYLTLNHLESSIGPLVFMYTSAQELLVVLGALARLNQVILVELLSSFKDKQ